MPKVTEAYRDARRDEIAQAAMRCLSRSGFAHTSMADIIAESGMSAGAIYSHFGSKAEIAAHVTRLAISSRGDQLHEWAATLDRRPGPADIVSYMMSAIDAEHVPKKVLLQIWAESTVDDELHGIIVETMGRIRSAYITELRPWFAVRGGPIRERDVERAASTMITLSQGWITHSAIFGDVDPAEYLASATWLLGNEGRATD
jgi:AcrR family transcriptional regulator